MRISEKILGKKFLVKKFFFACKGSTTVIFEKKVEQFFLRLEVEICQH